MIFFKVLTITIMCRVKLEDRFGAVFFFPGEISLFFNKEIGKILENSVSLVQI